MSKELTFFISYVKEGVDKNKEKEDNESLVLFSPFKMLLYLIIFFVFSKLSFIMKQMY